MRSIINLAPGLNLPLEIAGQAVCIFGIRGSGKTTTAGSLAEELLDKGHPIAVIDPTDGWWGLRAGRDGKDTGYPIVIFGGSHEDIPLRESDGRTIAEFLVHEQIPVILSLRHLRKAAQRRFVTEFCEEIYHLKGRPENRTPLTVFIDEAPLFVPQKVMGDVARTVGAVEDLIARGRNAGFGVVLISQRSATINADVRTQADTIICHRVTAALDRKAIEGWFEENASVEDLRVILKSLATLKNGEAWIWAPPLGIMSRVQMRMRRTFDSSATPKAGEAVRTPKHLADVDLDSLKIKMAAALEEKQSNDPHELKKKISDLERHLREKLKEQIAAKPSSVDIDNAVADFMKRKVVPVFDRMGAKLLNYSASSQQLSNEFSKQVKDINELTRAASGAARSQSIKPASLPSRTQCVKVHTDARGNGLSNDNLGKCERAILRTLAQFPDGCASGKLTLISGYRYSGGFKNSLTKLRSTSLMEGENTGVMKITSAGLGVIGEFEPLPTGNSLFDFWFNSPTFGRCEKAILVALRDDPGLDGPHIATAAGYEYSGGFKNALTSLRTAGVIVGRNTESMDLSGELRD